MSTEKKMLASLPPSCLPELRRGAFGRLFGQNIRSVREGKGLSIEQGACLSGMEVSEWAAIEEGYVPQDINRLRAIAGAIEIRIDQIAMLVLLCRDAWELQSGCLMALRTHN